MMLYDKVKWELLDKAWKEEKNGEKWIYFEGNSNEQEGKLENRLKKLMTEKV